MLFENQFKAIFNNKKVFVTGHTGFQGSWLSLWLKLLVSNVFGYEIAGKTGTALKYNSKAKLNTFVSLFPSSKPKYLSLIHI